ncbi:ABC transporter ATP-binding protein [Alkalicoccus daliensis]|uniref:ABC-2 type transport system ATP-binding protein n=1 Tax=Alkalicoccus daliensis TaxID=745820 RepID=A0A1H0HUX3_9BACI|nr:ABC transporter ATP-binding protein [Alkalicoccus daliensis]SDO22933.1 ABC-2 type transport system ATP-binding protein [Alkalicoccus daliensis]
MTMKIELDHVNLIYGRQTALTDISFSIHQPGIYGLLGRNGAGKTSLLSLLANYKMPTSGSLTLNDETLFENVQQTQHVHFTFQRKFEDEYEKGKDILNEASKFMPNFDLDFAFSLADRFQLDLKKPMHKHSTGMASIFQVIKGMATKAPITIFDEAYTGMDAPARELFYEIILEEQLKDPRIILLSTHLISEMEHLFDEVIILHKGKLLLHKGYEELLSQGASITGEASRVDRLSANMKVLKEQQLGGTKSVIVFEELNDALIQEIENEGLKIGNVTVQDVFTNLTKGAESDE